MLGIPAYSAILQLKDARIFLPLGPSYVMGGEERSPTRYTVYESLPTLEAHSPTVQWREFTCCPHSYSFTPRTLNHRNAMQQVVQSQCLRLQPLGQTLQEMIQDFSVFSVHLQAPVDTPLPGNIHIMNSLGTSSPSDCAHNNENGR